MPAEDISITDVQATSSPEGVQQLLARLGYDTSQPVDQTAASLGVARPAPPSKKPLGVGTRLMAPTH